MDVVLLREWMADLFDHGLTAISIRRKLASVRSLFKFLRQEGVLAGNPAARLRTPKAPKMLPDVMTAEKTNRLLDSAETMEVAEKPSKERDIAFLELLYGCGIRVSELVGIDLQRSGSRLRAGLRVRGKGNKERQVPIPERAMASVTRYLAVRQARPGEQALFVNSRGSRLRRPERPQTGEMVCAGDDRRYQPYTRTVSGMPMRRIFLLKELTCGRYRNCWACGFSTTQKYTQVSLADLMAVYDKAHPKAIGISSSRTGLMPARGISVVSATRL